MNIGDVVWLKSGSPAMTIVDIDTEIVCNWMTGNLNSARFPAAALATVDPSVQLGIDRTQLVETLTAKVTPTP